MTSTCDRCGPAVKAAYIAEKEDTIAALHFCSHCANDYYQALTTEGWILTPLDLAAIAPQAMAKTMSESDV
jgi:hypothetical protein